METQTHHSNFKLWLQTNLTERCRQNQQYSLRAFAQFLEMDASSVSQIISGKRKASDKVITKICNKLGASPIQQKQFLYEISNKATAELPNNDQNFELMAEDAFSYISNWYHLAILELTFVDELKNDPKHIARQLSISITESKMAIERLQRLDLLKDENGVLKKTNKFLTTFTPGFTSSATKELQRQVVKMALEAIDRCRPEEKDITSMTMAIDEEKLPEARKIITKFRRDMCAFLEDGEQTRVYNLAIQLYPISKSNDNNRSQQ